MSAGASRTIAYRPEIDGLRAIAVLIVIAFHAGLPGFSGGFVGVDVFFVISGYLITAIIARQSADGGFSFAAFYERRIRRILPALFTYAGIAGVLAIWLYPPHLLKQFGQSLASVAVFASNILFYLKTEYFNDFQETAPLLHTWSLSVEEQYYIVAPVLLMLCLRRSGTFALAAIGALLAVSLIHAQYMVTRDATFAFYMVTTRFWELAAGACLALAAQHWRLPKANGLLAALGLILIAGSAVLYTPLTQFPGVSALPPVIGTVMLIAFAHGEGAMPRMLGNRAFVAIGLVSYSWYLSHYVIFAVARSQGMVLGLSIGTAALIAISFALAVLTYRLIEAPARRASVSRKTVFISAIAGSFVVAALGYSVHATDGLRAAKTAILAPQWRDQLMDHDAEMAARQVLRRQQLRDANAPFDDTEQRKVLILGDSMAADFYMATRAGQFGSVQFRMNRFGDECMATRASRAPAEYCVRQWRALLASGHLDTADEVLLTSNWQFVTTTGVLDFIETLRSRNIPVSLVSNAEFTHASALSYNLARQQLAGDDAALYLYANVRMDRRAAFLELKAGIEARGLDARILDKLAAFCDIEAETCTLREEGNWLIPDSGHLTVRGFPWFAKRMKQLGWYE